MLRIALLLWKQYRQHAVMRQHAARAVAAAVEYHRRMPGAEVIAHVAAERDAAREPRVALRHRRAGDIKIHQRQNIEFPQHKSGRTADGLFD